MRVTLRTLGDRRLRGKKRQESVQELVHELPEGAIPRVTLTIADGTAFELFDFDGTSFSVMINSTPQRPRALGAEQLSRNCWKLVVEPPVTPQDDH